MKEVRGVQIASGNRVLQIKRQTPFFHPFCLVGKRPDTEEHFPQSPVLWEHMGMEQLTDWDIY